MLEMIPAAMTPNTIKKRTTQPDKRRNKARKMV